MKYFSDTYNFHCSKAKRQEGTFLKFLK